MELIVGLIKILLTLVGSVICIGAAVALAIVSAMIVTILANTVIPVIAWLLDLF